MGEDTQSSVSASERGDRGPGGASSTDGHRRAGVAALLAASLLLAACLATSPVPVDPRVVLVARGRKLFFEETFDGNGRTCGTCHPEENNFTLDPAFIASLPDDDPLFVAERVPALMQGFENPELMRKFGLILENLDGFDDLENQFVLRGIPHTLGLRVSVDSSDGPRTGWSGDGAPGDGSLRSFSTGAVIQHFTKSLDRVVGVDFRLPTDEELDALEAFMLSLGRRSELVLPLPLRSEVPLRGQEIFLDDSLGKCNLCHGNAGANATFSEPSPGNSNFDTGVEELPDQPADLTDELNPSDDGFGTPGDGTFNTPSLVEAADSGPFFHNNSVETLEAAVAFYDGEAFNNSPAGQFLASTDPDGAGIELDGTQIVAIAAFLRVLNTLENIRDARAHLQASQEQPSTQTPRELRERAREEIGDAIEVLECGGLHPQAVKHLREAEKLVRSALSAWCPGNPVRKALAELKNAERDLIEVP